MTKEIKVAFDAATTFRHESSGIALALADIAPEGLAYLLQYGFSKSLQDSVAGKLKVFMDGAKDDKGGWKAEPMSEDEARAEINKLLAERADDIRTGSVSRRSGGPRLKGLDWYMREVAKEFLAKFAKDKGKKLPSKAEDLAPILAQYTTKNESKIREEAQRRMDQANAMTDDDSDLLDGLEGL